MREYYKILGVNEDASLEEIEVAYKALKEQYSADVVINRYAKFYETMCEYNKHNKWGKK